MDSIEDPLDVVVEITKSERAILAGEYGGVTFKQYMPQATAFTTATTTPTTTTTTTKNKNGNNNGNNNGNEGDNNNNNNNSNLLWRSNLKLREMVTAAVKVEECCLDTRCALCAAG
ncbi:unnamed protein product [Polarella glacialis]|uniref:Uncharacterized protein n=1 Tax=Polarella glacialis TaxID=89957 RepID=A0A813J4A4_POLGL|nr:unnamed protein product [Polarella glacialis]